MAKLQFYETLNIVDIIVTTAEKEVSESMNIVDSLIKRILMRIREITIRVRGSSYESDIKLED